MYRYYERNDEKDEVKCSHKIRSLQLRSMLSFNNKPGIEEVLLVVLYRLPGGMVVYAGAGAFHNGVSGGCVPLHGGCQARVNVCPTFCYQAEFQGTASGDEVYCTEFTAFILYKIFERFSGVGTGTNDCVGGIAVSFHGQGNAFFDKVVAGDAIV